jgi:hypothetical protein
MAHTHLAYQERFYIEQRLAEGDTTWVNNVNATLLNI